MDLIKLTRLERNGKEESAPLDVLINVGHINRPISENISGNSVIYMEESITTNRQDEGINTVQHIMTENLAAISLLTSGISVGTVVLRNDKTPVVGAVSLGFVSEKIVGSIEAHASGCFFRYREDDGSAPVEYILSESVATFVSGNLPTPTAPLLYTSYVPVVTQAGTATLGQTVLHNNTGVTPGAWVRSSIGLYYLDFAGVVGTFWSEHHSSWTGNTVTKQVVKGDGTLDLFGSYFYWWDNGAKKLYLYVVDDIGTSPLDLNALIGTSELSLPEIKFWL